MEKIAWSAPEYEEKSRSSDWFWALGVIVVTASLAAVIYGNYFFAALIIISGVLLGYLATKNPHMVSYELNEKGFQFHSTLYPYENIKSFWVQKATLEPEVLKPMLFIKSERFFMPIITTPIENIMAEDIRAMLLQKKVPEEEMREHISEKIMEALGF